MDDQLRHRLSMMGREIEEVLVRHQLKSRVWLESLQDRTATYMAVGCGPISVTTWDEIEAECGDNLCAASVELTLDGDDLGIAVELPSSLALPAVLEEDPTRNAAVSPIGRDVDGQPVTLSFGDRNAEHILFFGGPGAGKTAVLRTSAVSLALASRQSQAQMIFIAPSAERDEVKGPGLDTLHYLPHALSAVARNLEDVANVLAFVAGELQHRRRCALVEPSIIVFLDDVDVLVEEGGAPVYDPLRLLLAEGAEYGIYIVMAARPAASGGKADITGLLTLKAVSQVLGRIDDQTGVVLGGRLEDAQHLRGRGDFLLPTGGGLRRFQAAYIDACDLYWYLACLKEQRPARLLAQTYA